MIAPVIARTPPKVNGVYLLVLAAVSAMVGLGNLATSRSVLSKSDVDERARQRARVRKYVWGYGIGVVAAVGAAVTGIVIIIVGR